ncbi:hypothetical protein BTR23_08750 [Alkalihalophilus pseudofirmus]|nr:hypothetical protein BTR23_08750 [Alkalihalophilus pseudofirmus]
MRGVGRLDLRGHHLLCLLGYSGHGYSPSFINKMEHLAPLYRKLDLDFDIYINEHTDEICEHCPAMVQNNCTTFSKVDHEIRELDRRINEKLQVRSGFFYSKKVIFRKIREKVEPDDLDILCKGCKWLSYGVCKEAIRKLKATDN